MKIFKKVALKIKLRRFFNSSLGTFLTISATLLVVDGQIISGLLVYALAFIYLTGLINLAT